jgi:hypothetical protein
VIGIATAIAGIADFAAARLLYRAQWAVRQAERTLAADSGDKPAQKTQVRRQANTLTSNAVRQADLAARWQMNPPRKLVAMLGSAQIRADLGTLPLLWGPAAADVQAGNRTLDAGLAILQRLEAIAPGYADAEWRLAELFSDKASLATYVHDDVNAANYRGRALAAALGYFGDHPLDRERIWQSFRLWPEIPSAQRLSLLRGTLRQEPQVWRQQASPLPAYVSWSQERDYATRMWQQLGEHADAVDNHFMEVGYSALRLGYWQWQDPLAPEGVRLVAERRILQGDPAGAAEALDLAAMLYQRAGSLLPYSQAATYLQIAACRIREGTDGGDWSGAAIVEARQILQGLPENLIRRQLLELADALEQGIAVASGANVAEDSPGWSVAVDLFCDLPADRWPARIQNWAGRADAALAAKGLPGIVTLQVSVGRGDADAARARARQLLDAGASRQAVESAIRQAAYRWPQRLSMAQELVRQLTSGSQPATLSAQLTPDRIR